MRSLSPSGTVALASLGWRILPALLVVAVVALFRRKP